MPLDRVRDLLLRDPAWSAYALADLDPPNSHHARWRVSGGSVVLVYREFHTPILFARGEPESLAPMLANLDSPNLYLQIQPDVVAAIPARYRIVEQRAMWRMRLDGLPEAKTSSVERLTLAHLSEIQALYREGDARGEAPDFFFPSMLERGVFYGARSGGILVAAAGTHVCEPRQSVAAIGNVYTHSAFRGRGLASSATAAVSRELLGMGCATVVLSVEHGNTTGLRVYEKLGFVRHCEFIEGLAVAPT